MKKSKRSVNITAIATATLLVAASVWLAACGGGSSPGGEVAAGKGLFAANCGLCHGQSGEGKPALGKGLKNNEFVQGLSDDELVEFLQVGRRADHPLNERGVDMPPRGGNPGLTDDDLRKIVAYVRSLS